MISILRGGRFRVGVPSVVGGRRHHHQWVELEHLVRVEAISLLVSVGGDGRDGRIVERQRRRGSARRSYHSNPFPILLVVALEAGRDAVADRGLQPLSLPMPPAALPAALGGHHREARGGRGGRHRVLLCLKHCLLVRALHQYNAESGSQPGGCKARHSMIAVHAMKIKNDDTLCRPVRQQVQFCGILSEAMFHL